MAANAPPQEAILACSSSIEGNSCSIQTPNGQLSGSCLSIQSQLACVPDSGNSGPPNSGTTSPDSTNSGAGSTTTSSNSGPTNTVIVQNGAVNTDSNESNNINVTIDTNTSSLFLSTVLVDSSVYYEVSLDVISYNPLVLELTNAQPINSSNQITATYNSNSGRLTIPSLIMDNQVSSTEFQLNNNAFVYQFELVSQQYASYNLVDTGQINCYNSTGSNVSCSNSGQDAAYTRNQPSYTNNGNGTILDNISGLTWQDSPDSNGDGTINSSDKMTQSNAVSYCNNLVLAGQTDWRLPNIKTMYSLINFSGEDPFSDNTSNLTPFIDTNYFDFSYGDTTAGERVIDMQYATSTFYVSTTMGGSETMFGVNLADGRIKGYGTGGMGGGKTFAVHCVRGESNYAINNFSDNNNNTISDNATGLMWEKNDSQIGMNWDSAISYCESGSTAGYTDWRLPNAKELQSIVDYTRSPDTSNSAAIDSVFNSTSIINEGGAIDWGFYWTNTTHKSGNGLGANAVYVAFGRALGYMNNQWVDVHGAGAQRSSMKSDSGQIDNSYTIVTDANGNQALAHGPQGDVVRVNNYVRCVRTDS